MSGESAELTNAKAAKNKGGHWSALHEIVLK